MESPITKTVDQTFTLDKLKHGMTGVITELRSDVAIHLQASDILRRLQELGFVVGETVKVLRRGFPGGDPIAVRIGSSTFALRSLEASMVTVLPKS